MSIAHYLKEIGRGKDGARALSQAQADDLMTQVLADRVDPLALGAFAIAMRIKGETADELQGFVDAARRHLMALPPAPRGVVWLPSYNGGRKLPNLTPLLARLLADQGVQVMVHGVSSDPARITTHELFEALGWPVCERTDEVADAWAHRLPAFVPIERLNPPLARLLAVRQVVGLRNPGHSMAKLLSPQPAEGARHFRVVNHTHPEYAESLTAFLQRDGADALLLRGTEGEPVADLRRTPAMQCFRRGVADSHHPLQTGSLTTPDLGGGQRCDLPQTVAYIRDRLQGSQPVPEPIRLQVERVLAQLAA